MRNSNISQCDIGSSACRTQLSKVEFTRSRFLNVYVSIMPEHMLGNGRCYGNGRTRIVLVLLVLAGKRYHTQIYVRCIWSVRNSF